MSAEVLMDHFFHPRNVGVIENADGVGKVNNPICGDVLRLYLKVRDDRIADARFQSFGCGAAAATASLVTERIKGKAVAGAPAEARAALAPHLDDLPMRDRHCSRLAEEALGFALEDYFSRAHPSGGSMTER
jgi:nitrogen fixation NifU-like protein